MSSFVVAILVGVGVLALLVFAFRSSRARQGGASDSGFVHAPDSPWFADSQDSDCSDSASDGGGCDGGGGGGD
ncbi:hypothetical protein [Dokdonella ginsengisoli]|uniref:Uncharacterized protein n=1 Tax=Dokdonella ginsengisoli TaxID=363846 RepID=A0ABV9QXC4_9GAMM